MAFLSVKRSIRGGHEHEDDIHTEPITAVLLSPGVMVDITSIVVQARSRDAAMRFLA